MYDNLTLAFGHVLELGLLPRFAVGIPTLRKGHITNEASLVRLIDAWNRAIVSEMLNFVQYQEQTTIVRRIAFTKGTDAQAPRGAGRRANFSGTFLSFSDLPRNRLPGFAKLSSKWRSNMEHGTKKEQDEFWRVLGQVVRYSAAAGTRYGYIITDQELFAFRRKTLICNKEGIDAVSVHWDDNGPEQLTINLALFALHALAAGKIRLRCEYPQIGVKTEGSSDSSMLGL